MSRHRKVARLKPPLKIFGLSLKNDSTFLIKRPLAPSASCATKRKMVRWGPEPQVVNILISIFGIVVGKRFSVVHDQYLIATINIDRFNVRDTLVVDGEFGYALRDVPLEQLEY
jgi:hypothetical protein